MKYEKAKLQSKPGATEEQSILPQKVDLPSTAPTEIQILKKIVLRGLGKFKILG